MTISIPLASAREGKLGLQDIQQFAVDRDFGAVMPKLKDIDVSHFLRKFTFLIELGVTGQQHAQTLSLLCVGEQQDERVLVALAINGLEWPHHAGVKSTDVDRITSAHLPI